MFLALGLGLLLLVAFRDLPFETKEGMATLATITTSMGVGLLLSAGASLSDDVVLVILPPAALRIRV